jgi:hypothetical protein
VASTPASSTAGKRRQRVQYAFTFEFDWDAPLTVRGEIEFLNLRNACSAVAKVAKQAHPRKNWRSVVLVLDRSAKV